MSPELTPARGASLILKLSCEITQGRRCGVAPSCDDAIAKSRDGDVRLVAVRGIDREFVVGRQKVLHTP
jgi:hypothetical protein